MNANVTVLGREEARDITEVSLKNAFLYPIYVDYWCTVVQPLLRGLKSDLNSRKVTRPESCPIARILSLTAK